DSRNSPRRQFLHLAAGAAALSALPHIARAQAYPTRPVRVSVPVASGGLADSLARLMGQWLQDRLGQPFVIENRPGAGNTIGIEAVVKAPPGGHTLLLFRISAPNGAAPYHKPHFNPIPGLAPIAAHSPPAVGLIGA